MPNLNFVDSFSITIYMYIMYIMHLSLYSQIRPQSRFIYVAVYDTSILHPSTYNDKSTGTCTIVHLNVLNTCTKQRIMKCKNKLYKYNNLSIQSLNRSQLSLSSQKFASSASLQILPTTYTRVNDFGKHLDSTYRRERFIRKYKLIHTVLACLRIMTLYIFKIFSWLPCDVSRQLLLETSNAQNVQSF